MSKKLVVVVISILLNFGVALAQKKDDLGGKWQGYKKELLKPRNGGLDSKPIKIELILILRNDGTVIESQANQVVSYYLFDSLLVLGNRKYLIEKISKEELIIVDIDETAPNNPFMFRYYFKRLDEDGAD